MGATPSEHLAANEEGNSNGNSQGGGVPWPLQDDMGVVIALPPPPPLKQQSNGVQVTRKSGKDYIGKRVLAVHSNSPASQCGLVPWLDYIIGMDGRFFTGEEDDFLTKGMEAGKKSKLHVFNVKSSAIRDCFIVPTLRKDSDGINGGGLFLGMKISSWQVPDVYCLEKTIRVMGVERKSPAFECGLEPEFDFILGSVEHGSFSTLDDLEYALIDKEGKVC